MSELIALWLGTFAAAVSVPPMLRVDEATKTLFGALSAVAWAVFALKIANVTVYSGGAEFQESHLSIAAVGAIACMIMVVFVLNSAFGTLTGQLQTQTND